MNNLDEMIQKFREKGRVEMEKTQAKWKALAESETLQTITWQEAMDRIKQLRTQILERFHSGRSRG